MNETREAVEAVEAIRAAPGADLIAAAAFDLLTASGVSGQFDHPDLVTTATRIVRVATAAELRLGGAALSRPQAGAPLAWGCRVIAGFDVLWLRAGRPVDTAMSFLCRED